MEITTEIRAKIDAWFEGGRSSALAADLVRLLDQKSVLGAPEAGAPYGRDARTALDLSRELLRERGIETTLFEDMMAEGVVAGTSAAEPLLGILVHVDVVDADASEWTSDPFRGAIRDGVIYGRGATDNKGPAIAAFYAAEAARELAKELGDGGGLREGLKILVGSAEEIGCVDITRWLEVNTPPRYVFAPDANYPLVNVEKGRFTLDFERSWEASAATPRVTSIRGGATRNIIPGAASATIEGLQRNDIQPLLERFTNETVAEFELTETPSGVRINALGKAAHSSLPWNGNNAQTALIALLNALPLAQCGSTEAIAALATLFLHGDCYGNALGVAMSDEVSGVLTLSFNVLNFTETGLAANFDSRTTQSADSFPLLDTAANALQRNGFAVTNHSMTLCHVTDENDEFVQTLLKIYRDFTGDTASKPLALGGTTYVHNIPGGVAFGTELPGCNNRIHGRDEFITIDELIESTKMFTAAILAICG